MLDVNDCYLLQWMCETMLEASQVIHHLREPRLKCDSFGLKWGCPGPQMMRTARTPTEMGLAFVLGLDSKYNPPYRPLAGTRTPRRCGSEDLDDLQRLLQHARCRSMQSREPYSRDNMQQN